MNGSEFPDSLKESAIAFIKEFYIFKMDEKNVKNKINGVDFIVQTQLGSVKLILKEIE
jgi:hypothetical protein